MAEILHPPKDCPDLSTLWFRYFDDVAARLASYKPDDLLSTNQAAYAMCMRSGTLFNIAKYDRQATAPRKRIGPAFVVPDAKDATFRPARMYRVSDLVQWIAKLHAERRTIYGEPIPVTRGARRQQLSNLARMIHLSKQNTTRAEKIAGRFLLRVGADLSDRIADQIAAKVARILAEQALAEDAPEDQSIEITEAPLDTGFFRPVDNQPDKAWPLSDPRVVGRTMSREQFRLALKALGMTTGQFADFWGCRRTTVMSWHNGAIPVPLAVADYLKTKVGAFVRLRCAELGLPVPVTALEGGEAIPTSKRSVDAVDTLRAMVAEENPHGRGHEAVIFPDKRGRQALRRRPPRGEAPEAPVRVESDEG
jgi:hypothetical protein